MTLSIKTLIATVVFGLGLTLGAGATSSRYRAKIANIEKAHG